MKKRIRVPKTKMTLVRSAAPVVHELIDMHIADTRDMAPKVLAVWRGRIVENQQASCER